MICTPCKNSLHDKCPNRKPGNERACDCQHRAPVAPPSDLTAH